MRTARPVPLAASLCCLCASAALAAAHGVADVPPPVCAQLPNHAVEAAEAGSVEAQAMVGKFLIEGGCGGDPQHFWKGVSWLEKASDRGHGDSALLLGVLFDEAGSMPDADRAMVQYHRAAAAGRVVAQHRLGTLMLEKGEGEEGIYWLGAAAGQGDAVAAVLLALIHSRGLHGQERDVCLAKQWFEASQLLGSRVPLPLLKAEIGRATRTICP